MTTIEHAIDLSQVRDLASGAARGKVVSEASRSVRDGLVKLQTHHKTQVIRRGAGKSPPVPKVWSYRTGEASRSFYWDWRPGQLEGAYGSGLARMRVLEEGGVVRPGPGKKFLAIPLPAARVGVGGAPTARTWEGLFVYRPARSRSQQDRLFLARRVGKRLQILFVLKRSVKLPPRPTLRIAAEDMEPELEQLQVEAMRRAIGAE